MTTYTAIPDSDIDPESPITTTLMTQMRDNPIAITEGAAGAPPIANAALAGYPFSASAGDVTGLGWALLDSWVPTAVASKDFTWDESLYTQINIVGAKLQVTSDGDITLTFGYANGASFYGSGSLPSATSSSNTARSTSFECRLLSPAESVSGTGNPGATDSSKTLVNSGNAEEHVASRDAIISGSRGTDTDSARLAASAGTFRAGVGAVYVYGLKRA
jgi:hypothetical protein